MHELEVRKLNINLTSGIIYTYKLHAVEPLVKDPACGERIDLSIQYTA